MPDDPKADAAPQPSPEAVRVNAIIQRALKAAQDSFNAVLIASGVVALDGEYDVEAQLTFRQRLQKPPELVRDEEEPGAAEPG